MPRLAKPALPRSGATHGSVTQGSHHRPLRVDARKRRASWSRSERGRVVTVEEPIGFGPVAAHVLAIRVAADAYDWRECVTGVYEFGQGAKGSLMFELGAVSGQGSRP